ncbi:MAG TPA: transcriptional regulator NrdR [Acidimicrobiales bacterium]|nr:transcriptional regulator NrdR [Acidimicrobiales bacterium]
MRCPTCTGVDDKVVDSRMAEDGTSIRRRRECVGCGRRFTTFERIEESPITVVKRSGDRIPFDRDKIVGGLRAAAKNRPVADQQLVDLAAAIEERLRVEGREVVSTESIGLQVLERLRDLDEVAYLRFASVYKVFEEPADFARELRLLTKGTAPKRH